VTVESIRNLLGDGEAAPSPLGIGIAAASLIVMPFLSWAQRWTGRELGSGSVVADSKQTLLCTYLSAVLLVGLVLNATLGWGWADPLAGLVIAEVAAREGLQAWRGQSCGCGPAVSAGSSRVTSTSSTAPSSSRPPVTASTNCRITPDLGTAVIGMPSEDGGQRPEPIG